MEGGGWRVEGGGWRVEGGGWSAFPRAKPASLRAGHAKRVGQSTTERRCRGDPSWTSKVSLLRRVPGPSMGEPLRMGEEVQRLGEEASVVVRLAGSATGRVLDSLVGSAFGGEEGVVRGELLGWVMRWVSVVLQLAATSIDGALSSFSWSARRSCEGEGA